MPLGQGSLGYQARDGRGQGPGSSFREASSSLLSCSGNLHNKGGPPSLFWDLFTLRLVDDGLGFKGAG